MTETSTDEAEVTQTASRRAPSQYVGSDEIDAMLITLVRVAQQIPGFGVGMTLTVRGATLTGQLVGFNDWLKKVHEAYGGEAAGLTQGWLEAMSYDPATDTDRRDADVYIHLADAHILSGNGAVPGLNTQGTFWRGLLASVDGWSLGAIESS